MPRQADPPTPTPDHSTEAGDRRPIPARPALPVRPIRHARPPRTARPGRRPGPPSDQAQVPTVDLAPIQRSVTEELGIEDGDAAPTLVQSGSSGGDATVDVTTHPGTVSSGPPAASGAPRPSSGLTRYDVRHEIARGGMGAIMTAHDRDLKRTVAMKVLLGVSRETMNKPSTRRQIRRFVAEAQITGQLEHPNIVPVHELGVDGNGRPWFTMKLVDGEELSLLINNLRFDVERKQLAEPLPVARGRLLEIFGKVCDAVAYAHSRGVLHRDLKPDNVMVGAFGDVLLMDWGIARARGADGRDNSLLDFGDDLQAPGSTRPVQLDAGAEARLTHDGSIVGTPVYMSPEQALGATDEIDERSDVYALGAMLYQLLTLTEPYNGDIEAVLKRVQSRRPVEPPRHRAPDLDIPLELEAICRTAMAPEPRRRYQSVEDLHNDLRRFQAGLPVSVHRDTRMQQAVRFVRRNPVVATLSAAALLVAIALGITLVQTLDAQHAREEQMATAQRAAEQESKRLLAESQKREAEQQQRNEEMRRLAAEQRFDELSELVGSRVVNQRDAVRREFDQLWNARPEGQYSEEFVRLLGPERIERFTAAFEAVLAVGDASGQREAFYDANDLYYLGMLQQMGQEDRAAAIESYTRALDLDAGMISALINRATCRAQIGQLDAAALDIDRAIQLQPESAQVWHTRGLLRKVRNELPGALEDFTKAARLDPQNSTLINARGVTLMDLGRTDEAMQEFEAAIALNAAEGFYNRGRLRVRSGDREGALADYGDCLARDRWHAGAWNNRGLLRRNGNDLNGAIADFRQAIRSAPANWEAYANLGHTLSVVGDNRSEALTNLQTAYRMCPDAAKRERIAVLIRNIGGQLPD